MLCPRRRAHNLQRRAAGADEAMCLSVIRCVASVLLLGNVAFKPTGADSVELDDMDDGFKDGTTQLARLLAVPAELLRNALVQRTLSAGGRASVHTVPMNMQQAC